MKQNGNKPGILLRIPNTTKQGHNYFIATCETLYEKKRLNVMDIYQVATTFWEHNQTNQNFNADPASPVPTGPDETPPFDPRPEVPVPDAPEETPPFEREPETPPVEPEPELPPVEPVVPETEPLPYPGGEPEIPAFN
jgi:hypothetical protein